MVCAAETSQNSFYQSELGMIHTLVNSNDILRKELESRSQKIEGLELRVKELKVGNPRLWRDMRVSAN